MEAQKALPLKEGGGEEGFFRERLGPGEHFVGPMEEGDFLLIRVKGTQVKKIFSKVYKKTFKATWTPLECRKLFEDVDCNHVSRGTSCEIYYRDFQGESLRGIEFFNDSNDFKIKLGSTFYGIKDDFFVEDGTLYWVFGISKEMLFGGRDLSVVLGGEEETFVRVGFQEFGKCPHRNGPGFSMDAPLEFGLEEGHGRREYEVNIHLLRR
ncbi:MAG: hypothetical protein OXB88_03025 [Bacteriovoracales bacterium]|nr:hypothetical protein [Bacteriovoracales bacterium]